MLPVPDRREGLTLTLFSMPVTAGSCSGHSVGTNMIPWMGQSFNSKAISTLGQVARHPSLAVPHLSLTSIAELDFGALKRMGIRGIVFDKDNTLTAPYVDEVRGWRMPAWGRASHTLQVCDLPFAFFCRVTACIVGAPCRQGRLGAVR